jgi:hypothetical protein
MLSTRADTLDIDLERKLVLLIGVGLRGSVSDGGFGFTHRTTSFI